MRQLIVVVWIATLAVELAAATPNIVLLMGDDHGWDETGYNDHPHVKTPVLDEMAASGLRLDRFYAAHPSCSPTRGSVMTGRHPVRYGTFAPGYSLRPEEITIAHLLSQSGYVCGHFGKWHLGPVKAQSPTNPGAMGFDAWVSHDNFFELNPSFSRDGGPPQVFEGESSEVVVAEAIRFIAAAKSESKPFFVVIWFGSPHEPYSGLERDLALYDALPASYSEQFVTLTSNETGRPVKRPLNQVLRERYAEITAMDRAIGQLRESLRQQRLRDNTLVWYCGDNGTPSGGIVTSPYRGRKGNLYEGGIRVPAVVEWPSRITTPQTSQMNTVTSDILPTLCALTDTALPARMIDGIDLTSAIDGQQTERARPIGFWSVAKRQDLSAGPYIAPHLQAGTTPLVKLAGGKNTRDFRNDRYPQARTEDFAGGRALLDDRYKLIVKSKPGDDASVELFDVRADPAERENLHDAEPEVAAAMLKQLVAWQRSVLDSLTGGEYQQSIQP